MLRAILWEMFDALLHIQTSKRVGYEPYNGRQRDAKGPLLVFASFEHTKQWTHLPLFNMMVTSLSILAIKCSIYGTIHH